MFAVIITEKSGDQQRREFDKSEITIGRVQGNDVILGKGNVSKRHSRIVLKDGRFIVVDLKSTNGTYVNGRKITSPLVVKPGDKIYIGDFILTLEELQAHTPAPAEAPPAPSAPPARPKPQTVPPPLPPRPAPAPVAPAPAPAPRPQAPVPASAPAPRASSQSDSGVHDMSGGVGSSAVIASPNSLTELMRRVANQFELFDATARSMSDGARRAAAEQAVQAGIDAMSQGGLIAPDEDQASLVSAALRESLRLGALGPLLADPQIKEIVIAGPGSAQVDLGEGLQPVPAVFSSRAVLALIARRLVASAGEAIPDGQYMFETTLPDGAHVLVVLPPVAPQGPVIEVRRARPAPDAESLVAQGWMSEEMRGVLAAAVGSRRNIIVSGAAGSGVTTVVGALASLIDEGERIVTIEDVPDMGLGRGVSLCTGGPGTGISLAHLTQQGARLGAHRLVIDDVRDGNARSVLTTVASRGGGDIVGVHIGSDGADGPAVLTHLVRQGGVRDLSTARDLVAAASHIWVHLERTDQGRKIASVAEVKHATADGIGVKALFKYDGAFRSL